MMECVIVYTFGFYLWLEWKCWLDLRCFSLAWSGMVMKKIVECIIVYILKSGCILDCMKCRQCKSVLENYLNWFVFYIVVM